YYEINRDLPVSLAKKAKSEGVKQFIFLSSMIVYGNDKPLGISFSIDINTKENPDSFYGKSKLEAELLLQELVDDSFIVLIVRLPMVYGPGCKGNFPKLLQIAKKSPVCPLIENQRSMIYIDNLCEYLYQSIITKQGGIGFPQNEEYVSTTQVLKIASDYYHHKVFFTRIFNPLIYFLSRKVNIINRIYGTKVYDKSLFPDIKEYNIVDFLNSIKKCIDFDGVHI
ncbi:MAG: NAD-dependent epimerase/dehydratase family protein, partial [Lachnoclostridium sp.]|nr:NAD-dependent epimerase/dehydratase family protein [Lachnoclostridium sp.]